ncbi:Putative uncharacterized transposon-derived protein [Frankliniella fusca]|uniref:Uncharacterized transposon-derived protein n=1 Tax=Frankliniella fusca TaxID=407009 RepID=A0AAE1HAJ9_9NEOP|nr:Putative uncharacterized transposon-derived protein [Frankliniella fusca]
MPGNLGDVFHDPAHPATYGTAWKLWNATGVSKEKTHCYLQGEDAFTLHKPARRRFPHNVTYADNIDESGQTDLTDFQSLKKDNGGNSFILCVIDVFSKYGWAVPMKDKSGTSIVKGFEAIFEKTDRRPTRLFSDKGKEPSPKIPWTPWNSMISFPWIESSLLLFVDLNILVLLHGARALFHGDGQPPRKLISMEIRSHGKSAKNTWKLIFLGKTSSMIYLDVPWLMERLMGFLDWEYMNKTFQKFLKDNSITYVHTHNPDIKCSVVERWQRTIKSKLFKRFTYTEKYRYVDGLLDDIVDA